MRKKTKTNRETKVTKVIAERRLDTNLVRNKNNKQENRQNKRLKKFKRIRKEIIAMEEKKVHFV